MSPLIFVKSFIAGVAMCLPAGPISIIIIRRTVQYNKRSAFIVGVGSASADIFYGTIVGFGLTRFASFFKAYAAHLQICAAIILIIMSFRILRNPLKKLSSYDVRSQVVCPIKGFLTGFFLALFNPMTLVFMVSLLAAFGVTNTVFSLGTSMSIILGLFAGELCWWFLLVRIAQWAKNKIGDRAPITIHKFTGIFLLVLGLFIIFQRVFF